MNLNIDNIYHLITICLALLFSMYLFFNKTKERLGNIFLGYFILDFALESFDVLLSKTSFYTEHPNFYLIIPAFAFLIYPSWFFYIKTTAFKDYKLRKVDLLHLIPFIAITIIFLFSYHLQPDEIKLEIRTNPYNTPLFVSFIYYLLRIQGIVYGIWSIKIVYRFKKIVNENYSNINDKNYKWILQLTIVFVYFILTALVYNIFKFGFKELYEEQNIHHHISSIITLIFLSWIVYKGMSQPYLFNGVDSNIKLLEEYLKEKKGEEKKSKSNEITTQDSALKDKIEEYVITNKIYTNSSITLFELANGLGMSSYELSLFLNKTLNKNFFDYINEFRIKNAMEILQNPDKKNLTILEILYEVGFNSKSSFNTAFKKFTKQTPTQYRENTLKSRS
ncbi:helix-turn-helix transcriptional regulator [Gaetbulibacter aquiaggeris]|uniref:Helix-turn-helix transcriptional regulator n=1 Tax=Gaetbulibacter aquiaggeris TaxID=1735373 RepID=A0ABW7MNC8_9FLAO